MPSFRSFLTGIALTLGAASLTACASDSPLTPPSDSSPSGSSSPNATTMSPEPSTMSPSPTWSTGAEWPTAATIDCDSMLDAPVGAALRAEGLTPAPKEWTQFGFDPALAALECPWGVEGSTATRAYYAWAQLAPGEREAFVALVTENGYALEESDRGHWLVTPPERQGGGELAALITAEWVAFADSRSQIDDIAWTH